MSTIPPSPGYFSDNPYHTPQGYDANLPRRGMVNHVRVAAILNGVQGGLELLMSVMYLGMGGFFIAMKQEIIREGGGNPMDETMAMFMPFMFFALGGGMVVLAILRIVAAVRNYFFLGRVLGIVTLCLGLGSSLTCYCAPTSIAIAVYGLIVLFNRPVTEAFEMRAKGATADQVLDSFNTRPN